MKTISKLMVLLLLAGICFAKPVASDGEPAAKAHHAKKKVEKKAAVCEACEAIKQLKEQIQAQQAEIDQLKRDQANQTAETDAQKAAAAAAAAQQQADAANAAAAAANAKAAAAQSDVAGLKTTVDSTAAAVQKDEKRVANLEEPAYIHYKGVRLTPGGYAQFATIYRSKNANADTADQYGNYLYANSPNYHMSEFRATGRASRLSLKAEGDAKGMKFMSYVEIDFLGAAGGTEVQTNSFAPRLRLAFANVDLPGGWSIAGGQNWSLLQTTRKGIDPLTEWLPSVIDNSYVPGFSYARQGSIRVVKQITPKVWFGASIENPDTVSVATCSGNVTVAGAAAASACSFTGPIQGLANLAATTSPNNGFLNATSGTGAITGNPSTNLAPDLVAKLAFEPGWGHYEVKYIARWFRDRVYPNYFGTAPAGFTSGANTFGGTNKTSEGGALGFGAVLPVMPKKVDIGVQALFGEGIGRFGTTGGPDVIVNPNSGALTPVKGVQAIVGIETHPTPKFDFNLYGGGDYYRRITYFVPAGNTFFGAPVATTGIESGYGNQSLNDTGCSIEGNANCSGIAKDIWAGTAQVWYRMYRGKAGAVQFGASYSYVYKEAWAGRGTANATLPVPTGLISPKSINQISMTSFRYYLP